MAIRTFKKTIGLVGIGWSGKTILLTSLLSHLKCHDENKLVLKSNGKTQAGIIKFQEIRQGMDLPFFELEKARNTLVDTKNWPGKTTDAAYYRCTFERTDWSWSDVDLTFLDFPGERFNDALMFSGKGDFEDWSDAVFKRIEDDPACRRLAEEYFQVLAAENLKVVVNAKNIVMAYKRTLARFMLNYGAFITPSVFALNQQGETPKYSQDLDEIAASALTGLHVDDEFAPLPASFRQNKPVITKVFSEFYQEYRIQVAERLFSHLRSCDKLMIVIDIPGLLAANVGRFNDTEVILDYVLSASVKEKNWLSGSLTHLYNWVAPSVLRANQLDSIGFVATKADMVKYDQIDTLRQLLRELVKKKIKNYQSITHEFFVCSAIKSTVMMDGHLLGHPVYDATGKHTRPPRPNDLAMRLQPSDLPTDWPDYWESGQAYFPEVWPMVPHKKSAPPNQSGLEAILNFILEND